MFFTKKKESNLEGKYVKHTDVISVRKMDDVDLEFIRRTNPDAFSQIHISTSDYYIISYDALQRYYIVNESELLGSYTKLEETSK